jgi:hypothetical protein
VPGRAFYPVLAALRRFGEDWLWEGDEVPKLQIFDRETGEPIEPRVVDERTGRPIDVRRVGLGERSQDIRTRSTPDGSEHGAGD